MHLLYNSLDLNLDLYSFWISLFSGPYPTLLLTDSPDIDLIVTACIRAGLVLGGAFYLILPFRSLRSAEASDKKAQSRIDSVPQPGFIGKHLYVLWSQLYLKLDEHSITQEKIRLADDISNHIIQVKDVQKIHSNKFQALHDLSFGVQKGRIFCLLGPNGAGKSTAFDILTGRISRTSGSVLLSGHSLPKQGGASHALSQAGLCLQSNSLWEYMTVRQHLSVYASLKGIGGDEANEIISFLLDSLYMKGDANKKVDTLSGGTKRKLCTAIALLAAPELIFLDEPSTAMDPLSRRRLWILVKGIMNRTNGSTVLTTHFMQEAEQVADKVGRHHIHRFSLIFVRVF